jgi:hypothetical protein
MLCYGFYMDAQIEEFKGETEYSTQVIHDVAGGLGLDIDNLKAVISTRRSRKRGDGRYRSHALYLEEEKIFYCALYYAGMDTTYIQRLFGVHAQTVNYWLSGINIDSNKLKMAMDTVVRSFPQRLLMLANRAAVHAFKDDKLEKASTLQLVTSAAILIEKSRLLDGNSTQNVDFRFNTINNVAQQANVIDVELENLQQKLRELSPENEGFPVFDPDAISANRDKISDNIDSYDEKNIFDDM